MARPSIKTTNVLRVGLTVVTAFALTTVKAQEGPSTPPQDYRAGVLSAEFPYESKYIEVLGSKMHYIDQGQGDVFLFLHGNPTSSYLWRNVMRYVAPHGRIVAVDNIGFGKSDKPDVDYTFQSHLRYTEAFIDALDLGNIILVVHDWGSALGLYYAARHADNVKGVVFMEPITPPTFPMAGLDAFGPAVDLFRRFRDPVEGKKALIDENLFIEVLLANATITRKMTEEEMDVYRAPFLEPESRYPIYMWPNELPVGGTPARNVRVVERIGEWLRTSETPKLLQYASPGAIMPPQAAEWAARNFRNIETQFVGYGRHYIQEDNPEAIGRGIVDWYRRLETNGQD
ncbi:MAG: haloalkane dehalogenase [Planctomycetes bacterium]|nr:haloalkane dehalogenase [Planctomycetota bacterium]